MTKSKRKVLILKMSKNQFNDLRNFLSKHKILLDGTIPFGLIAEPRTNEKEFIIKLLSEKQYYKIDELFTKMGINKPIKSKEVSNQDESEEIAIQILALFPPTLTEEEIQRIIIENSILKNEQVSKLAHALSGRIAKLEVYCKCEEPDPIYKFGLGKCGVCGKPLPSPPDKGIEGLQVANNLIADDVVKRVIINKLNELIREFNELKKRGKE